MNREILFRGKQIDNGEWIEGIPIKYQSFPDWWNSKEPSKLLILSSLHDGEDGGIDAENYYEVDPSTVCEYTGLTDRNGVKIFEGDIARGKYGSTVYQNEVIFAGDGFALRHSYDQYGYCASLEEHDGLEVIGNIFDHPELLEENNT